VACVHVVGVAWPWDHKEDFAVCRISLVGKILIKGHTFYAHVPAACAYMCDVSHKEHFVNLKTRQISSSMQSLGGAHRGRVCVRAFIGVSVCAYV
jgi:hypothetical protein